jgi:peptidoglycan/LPS O-acetylase OafA/YrhL
VQDAERGRLSYLPALDGLRAAAVVAVLLYHGGVSWMRGGYLAVDAFFVLSGFLITSLLLAEWRADHTIRLTAFWARRARRLLPALFLVVVGVAAYAAWLAPVDQLDRLRADALATLGYSANWHFIFSGRGYFEQFAAPSPLRHTWSLAIEEQFYLLWPIVVLAWLRLRRGSTRGLLAACVVLGAASAVAMAVLVGPRGDVSRVYYGTDTRAQALLVGAALGVLVHRRGVARSHGTRRVVGSAALVGTVFTAWLWTSTDDTARWMYRGGYAVAAIAVVLVIASVARPDVGPLGRALSFAPIRWIGRISYGLYLWHWPVFVVCVRERMGITGTPLLLVRLAITFALATASFYVVEQPVRQGALRRWRARVFTPAAAAAVVGVVIVSTVGGHPLYAVPGTSVASRTTIAKTLPSPSVAASRVLVVGDSVALTLAEGMANVGVERGISVRDEGSIGCGLIRGGDIWYQGQLAPVLDRCAQWPVLWAEAVQQFQPDVAVVLVGTWDAYDRNVDGRWVRFGTPEWDTGWTADLHQAVDVLSSGGARVVVLTVPYYEYRYSVNAPDLSRSVFDRSRVDHMNRLIRALAADPRVAVVDLNGFLSPDGRVHETVDGQVVQGDGVHFTPWGSRYVSDWLLPKLKRLPR